MMRWRREKKKREGISSDCLFHPLFNSKKKKKPETSRLNELKDKKHLDNKSKAYFGLSVDFHTFLRPSWTMEMFIIGISNEE